MGGCFSKSSHHASCDSTGGGGPSPVGYLRPSSRHDGSNNHNTTINEETKSCGYEGGGEVNDDETKREEGNEVIDVCLPDANPKAYNQRRRLSVSQSDAAHEQLDDSERGVTVMMRGKSDLEILRSLSSPRTLTTTPGRQQPVTASSSESSNRSDEETEDQQRRGRVIVTSVDGVEKSFSSEDDDFVDGTTTSFSRRHGNDVAKQQIVCSSSRGKRRVEGGEGWNQREENNEYMEQQQQRQQLQEAEDYKRDHEFVADVKRRKSKSDYIITETTTPAATVPATDHQEVTTKSANTIAPPPPVQDRRRLSISGCLSNFHQNNFENKIQEMKGSPGNESLSSMGIGFACRKGLKPESPNQDDFFIVKIDDWGLHGVFDGHGPYGHDVSNYIQKELPRLIYDNEFFWNDPLLALKTSFTRVHNMLIAACSPDTFDCSLSGSTATVVLHRPLQQKLFVAHVGDSRAVLGRLQKPGSKKCDAVDLTDDHKPTAEVEKKRIIQSGGQVKRLEGDIPYRVFLKGKPYPGLAMSRAIGDIVGCQAGVIPIPDVSEAQLDQTRDLFMLVCSDGVWEFVTSQEAVDIIHEFGFHKVQLGAEALARESWQRWINEEGNVVDDITVQVVYLYPETYLT
eukprot:GHVS01041359.1.p1 GENE.GHVS01041359.1~~GHVS01041359.1.p1  ORF type:complete len:681 (-),score=155.44 GHVS01041359.1:632-2509(-)